MMMKAAWWHPESDGKVFCELCPIACTLSPGQSGPCGTRANVEGEMQPLHFGEVVAAGMDPIEKKPLYHFHPGRQILSVAAPGCNLHCLFCQNANISQGQRHSTSTTTPQQVIEAAVVQNSVGIAYTYSEPLVWFEFVKETAERARAKGLKNVLVTNGFLNPGPLAEILPFIDAANIDLKSMDDDFYRKICKARVEPVLAAIRQFHQAGVHLELTCLLIPGHNDSDEQINNVVEYVAGLDTNIPLHFSAYHPAWKMDAPPTPASTMLRALELARAKLPWVYVGNISTEEGRDTLCTHCGFVAIQREAYEAEVRLKENGRCLSCDRSLPIVVS